MINLIMTSKSQLSSSSLRSLLLSIYSAVCAASNGIAVQPIRRLGSEESTNDDFYFSVSIVLDLEPCYAQGFCSCLLPHPNLAGRRIAQPLPRRPLPSFLDNDFSPLAFLLLVSTKFPQNESIRNLVRVASLPFAGESSYVLRSSLSPRAISQHFEFSATANSISRISPSQTDRTDSLDPSASRRHSSGTRIQNR